MKRFILSLFTAFVLSISGADAKDLVVFFSATGNTQAVAEEIAQQMSADLLRIEAAEPYAANPYNDSDRVQDEAYNDKRPGVANLPSAEFMAQYDRIFVGSPIWWHQPAMVVCTFLEAFDLKDKTIIPFFTYGSTTYLNESMHKIYKVTPDSRHIPETLPEDLNPDDITTPGPADDSGIDMPGNARGVKAWLERLGLLGNETAIGDVKANGAAAFMLRFVGEAVQVDMANGKASNTIEVYDANGVLLRQLHGKSSYTIQLPRHAVYTISANNATAGKRYSRSVYIQ